MADKAFMRRKMKILVYGAGVIGCELAHVLKRSGNDVTLLARGEWKETLKKRGLVIRHYLQRKTTMDRVKVIGELEPDDKYDIIFVVMQAGQLSAVLPAIADNTSRRVVLIGNNPYADRTERMVLSDSSVKKEVAFGFLAVGGRREKGQVISIHAGIPLTVGGRSEGLSADFRRRLTAAFSKSGCKLTWEDKMDAWLKCHMAEVLPIGYVCYAVDCCLPKASRAQRKAMVDATAEGFALLKKLDYPVRPAGDESLFTSASRKKLWRVVLYVMCKTPLGRLAASDHCAHAVSEMAALEAAWEELRAQKPEVSMPVWDLLRRSMPAAE